MADNLALSLRLEVMIQ